MSYKKILFVCKGNSCSSPMAEAIMGNLIIKTNLYWEIDSAGLRPWNIGRRPSKRCLRVLREHGLRTDHYCRLLSQQDFNYFDYIIAMNMSVYKELLQWAKHSRTSKNCDVTVLSCFSQNGQEGHITDLSPFKKLRTFRKVYYQIKDCCKAFICNQNMNIVYYEDDSTETESTGESESAEYRKHNEILQYVDHMAAEKDMTDTMV